MIEVFERAECKEYAEEVRRIVQLSNSKTVHSSGEHSQPPAYPASDEPQSLSQVPPAMPMPTEVYEMREGTPPEGIRSFANYMHCTVIIIYVHAAVILSTIAICW